MKRESLKTKVENLINDLEKADKHDQKKMVRTKISNLGKVAAPLLIPFLKSKNEFTRWEIVSFLGEFQETSTMKPLIEFAIGEDEVHARWRSFWAVTRFANSGAKPILIHYLESENFKERWRAALILSMLGENNAGKVLSEGLKLKDSWIKWEALSAIKSLKYHPECKNVCKIALNEKNENLRREAVLALGYLDTLSAADTLIKCLNDTSAQVRWRASMSLARYSNPEHIKPLKKRLESETEEIVINQLKQDIESLKLKS